MTELTDEQQRAVVTREVSVHLSSGAGCGKTHVLTERYLSHLHDDAAEVGEIVAITFTERAARQMRARIRKAVLRHVRDANDETADRWARHLRSLESATITTIHSFCGTLLRQHAVEAGLDPQFEVLEDVLSVNLETEALNGSLQKLLTAKSDVGEDLRQLVRLYGWPPVVEGVRQLVESRDARGWRDWLNASPEELAARWQQKARTELMPRFVAHVWGNNPRIGQCVAFLRENPPAAGPLVENVAILVAGLLELPAAADIPGTAARLEKATMIGRNANKAWPDAAVCEQAKEAMTLLREELRRLRLDRFDADPDALPEAARVGQRLLRVATEALLAYQERKRLHGVVDFQDLLVLTRDLLRDQEEVRAGLQERYRFFLIDELQDTDPVQMELVEYLCGGGLTAGKLFAVGDHAQSIYRFRGADVHLFRHLREQLAHEGRQGLSINFRSQPAILAFANALFGTHLTDYRPLRAHHPQVNPNPCVEFLWTDADEKLTAPELRTCEADSLARRIAAMIRNGEELVVERKDGTTHLRSVTAGDVVLLFRAMTNVHLYEAALREHGLDYYLVGGRAFFAQQEIYDLLNLLRALENPQDEISLAGTLRSPFCCVSDEALFVLRTTTAGRRTLWAGLHDDTILDRLPREQREPVLRARRFLDRWHALKDRLPIARLLGEVFAESGYDAATQFEFLGERKLANLWKLLDLARSFDRSGLFGLAEFIDRLGDLVRNQPREEQAATQPENADVVRLMSIHQAKGLEFPVVIVPDLNAERGDPFPPIAHWDAQLGCVCRPPKENGESLFPEFGWALWKLREQVEDWNESLRTLYVACTRARDYLILSGAFKSSARSVGPWMQVLEQRFDRDTGQCLVPDLSAGEQPRVTVVRGPDVPAGVPAPAAASVPRGVEEPGHPEPVPCQREGQTVFSLAELEAFLATGVRQPTGRIDGDVPPALALSDRFAPRIDDEDGLDVNAWPARRDLLEPETGERERERAFRWLWQNWDFRDSGRIQLQLERAVPRDDLLTDWVQRLRRSDLHARLAAAPRCLREQEFLLPWPGKKVPARDCGRPIVRGVVDTLWRDEDGAWNLLAFSFSPLSSSDLRHPFDMRPGLVFWPAAVEQLCGARPRELLLYSLADGALLRMAGRRLSQVRLLERFAAAVDRAV